MPELFVVNFFLFNLNQQINICSCKPNTYIGLSASLRTVVSRHDPEPALRCPDSRPQSWRTSPQSILKHAMCPFSPHLRFFLIINTSLTVPYP